MGYIATDRLHNRHVSMAEIFFADVFQLAVYGLGFTDGGEVSHPGSL